MLFLPLWQLHCPQKTGVHCHRVVAPNHKVHWNSILVVSLLGLLETMSYMHPLLIERRRELHNSVGLEEALLLSD